MPFLYSITIDNEEVEAQIGISTSRKWEEALDESTLVVPFTFENDIPYKMLCMMQLEITEIDNYTDKNTVATKTYDMLIYSDDVQSLGAYGYYKHQVNAIEFSAKLDYYMINNLSLSRSVLKNVQAPFKTSEMWSSNETSWVQKVTLENINLKQDFYANSDLVIDEVYQAYVQSSGEVAGYKRTDAVIKTNATLVSGTNPHTLSDGSATWVFPEGEWEIEYGFIADGTEGSGYDVGFNAVYTFYVEAVDKYELSMGNVINEIRDCISTYGGIEDTIYYDATRVFDIDPEYEDYVNSIQAPQIYLSKATARQTLVYVLSFINSLPRLELGEETNTLTLEQYNLSTGSFVKGDVVAYGGSQNTNQIGMKNYQQITQALANNLDDTSVHSPSRSGYQQVRSLDVQLTADNFAIKLPESSPLYMPIKLTVVIPEISVYAMGGAARVKHLTDYELDLTPRWINAEEWKLKDITTNFPNITSRWIWDDELGLRENKVENLYWQVGDTEIKISDVFGTLFEGNLIHNVVKMQIYEYIMLNPPVPILVGGGFDNDFEIDIDIPSNSEYKDWRFRVEYITDERLVIKQDKEDLEQISFYSEMMQNQEESLVNIVRQSRKGYGDLQRVGNRTFKFPKVHTSLSEFYQIGQTDSDDFTITQIDTQWYNDYAIANYTVTKYHNRIQQATFVNQKYRPFDNFAKSVLERHEHYGDYLIAIPPGDTNSEVQEQSTKIYDNDITIKRIVQILLGNDFDNTPTKPQASVALIRTDGMLKAYPETSGSFSRKFLVSPVTARGIKGGFAFTFGFKNNQVAGDGLIQEGSNYYNSAVRYTDTKGRFNRFGFMILRDLEFETDEYATYPLIERNAFTFLSHIEANTYFWCGNYFGSNLAFKDPLVWNKDPMTNARLTYQLNVSSYYMNEYIFGLKFFTENYIVKEHETINKAKLYLYTDGTKYQLFQDLFVKSGYDSSVTLRDNSLLGDGNIEYDASENTVSFVGISLTNVTSWAIGIPTDDGDIELLLACNNNHNGVQFVNRHYKPDILPIGGITTKQEFVGFDSELEFGLSMTHYRSKDIGETVDVNYELSGDFTYVRGEEVVVDEELGFELSGDFTYVRGNQALFDEELGFELNYDLSHVRGSEAVADIDAPLNMLTNLLFYAGDSVPLTITDLFEMSYTITYNVNKGTTETLDLGLETSYTVEFWRTKDIGETLDLGLNLDTDLIYYSSKDIGETLDAILNLDADITYEVTNSVAKELDTILNTSFDIQYGRSTEATETMDLSTELSYSIEYTKYEPQYDSPLIQVVTGTLGTDLGGDYYYALYRVKNTDEDTGRVGSNVLTSEPSFVLSNLVELDENEWSDYMEIRGYYTSGTPKLYAQTRDVAGEDDKEVSEIVVWDDWS